MLDLKRLRRISLVQRPVAQRLLADLVLRFDYAWPRRTEIVLEGIENLPQDRSVFIAMNHTDRYNYWPLQYAMHRRRLRYTATWVKPKYFERPAMAWFMEATNNIPLPSRGWLISAEFRRVTGRAPGRDEYRALRDWVDRGHGCPAADGAMARFVGHDGGVARLTDLDGLFTEMMGEVIRVNRQAIQAANLHVLVFPEGTRRLRLGQGRGGMMQMAQHLGAAIVPVGCNGSDAAYPGASPFSKGGRLVYRIGKPLEIDGPALGPLRVEPPFVPFSRAAAVHAQRFAALTDVVMDRINGLLDPRYQRAESGEGAEIGAERFL